MTRIALVISDVDGTLLTRDKVLTDKAARAARQLQDSGVGFTIVSSRPTIGMRFLIEPLRITLPIGSFNGSSITDPQLNPIEQHLIPTSAAQRSLKVLNQFKVDIWLFTNDKWLTRNRDGEYNPLEKRAIKTDPVIVEDFDAETRFEVPAYVKDHNCKAGVTVSIAGRDGRAYGILGVGTAKKRRFRAQEISFLAAIGNLLAGAIQRRQLEQRHELMIRDMRHRSGNLFSQLLALFSQTARTSKGIPDLTSKYQARVLAMANAHRLITEGGWKSIPIMELLYVVLGAYIDRVAFEGPNFDLEPDPVFHLSAALHELAANASKHGSLSRPKGQLELRWSVSRGQSGMTLALDWIEKNGPPARRPRKLGFGMRLIDLVIRRQLNGEVAYSYSRKGLSVKFVVPLTHERWPNRSVQTDSLVRAPLR